MLRYAAYRVMLLVPILLGVTLVVFGLNQMIPGDPVDFLLDADATPADREYLRAYLGLDRPLPMQYFTWLGNLLEGDFGRSFVKQRAVLDLILESFANTLILILAGGTLAIVVALVIGILSALYPRSPAAMLANVLGISGVSLPNFWVALLLIGLFSVTLGWLPASGMRTTGSDFSLGDLAAHIILPAITVGLTTVGTMTRIVRAAFADLLKQDFVLALKAKGSVRRSILAHVFKNALPPILTVAGLEIGSLLGGSVITESIFSWPGVGKLMYDAITQRDYPVIQGGILFVSFLFVSVNVLVDVLHGCVDPRIRKSLRGAT